MFIWLNLVIIILTLLTEVPDLNSLSHFCCTILRFVVEKLAFYLTGPLFHPITPGVYLLPMDPFDGNIFSAGPQGHSILKNQICTNIFQYYFIVSCRLISVKHQRKKAHCFLHYIRLRISKVIFFLWSLNYYDGSPIYYFLMRKPQSLIKALRDGLNSGWVPFHYTMPCAVSSKYPVCWIS